MTTTYSTTAVAQLTGATPRQLDYWCRIDLLGPDLRGRGSGSRRRWTSADVEAVHALTAIYGAGLSVDRIHGGRRTDLLARAVELVRSRPVQVGEWLVVTVTGNVERVEGDAVAPFPVDGVSFFAVPLTPADVDLACAS